MSELPKGFDTEEEYNDFLVGIDKEYNKISYKDSPTKGIMLVFFMLILIITTISLVKIIGEI